MELEFGNILRCLRKSHGLTQGQLAEALGVVFSTISMYERKERLPDIETLLSICAFFDVDANYILGFNSKPKNSLNLTPHETKVMTAYRNQPDMQPAVDKLLGVTDNGVIVLSQAARSTEHRKPGYEQKPVEKWTAIENAPETDDDLL